MHTKLDVYGFIRGRDRMVVGFTTVSAYHHESSEFEPRS